MTLRNAHISNKPKRNLLLRAAPRLPLRFLHATRVNVTNFYGFTTQTMRNCMLVIAWWPHYPKVLVLRDTPTFWPCHCSANHLDPMDMHYLCSLLGSRSFRKDGTHSSSRPGTVSSSYSTDTNYTHPIARSKHKIKSTLPDSFGPQKQTWGG